MTTRLRGVPPAPFGGIKNPGGVLPADLMGTSLPPPDGVPPRPAGTREFPITEARQVFPWWERPPVGYRNFNQKVQAAALPASGIVAGPTFDVPNGYWWVVRGLNIFVDSPTPNFNVNYLLQFNDVTLGDPYTTFGRNASSIEIAFPIAEYGYSNGKISISIQNQNAFAWTVGAMITGWIAPAVNCSRTEVNAQ